MRLIVGTAITVVILVYVAACTLVSYEQNIAPVLHFSRASILTAAMVLFFPSVLDLFKNKPSPPGDYLMTGILLLLLSNNSFSTWNEMGRIFGIDTRVFTSPIAGFFSLMALGAGVFCLLAPPTKEKITKPAAIFMGLIFGVTLVFILPLFR